MWRQFIEGLPKPARTLLLATVAVVVGLMLWVTLSLVSLFFAGRSEIAAVLPRIERLQGYVASEAELRQAHEVFTAALGRMAYPTGIGQSEAGAELQQALRGLAENAGMTISGSQLVQQPSVIADENSEPPMFETLVVRLSMTGSPESIHEFMLAIAEFQPALAVDSLAVTKPRLSPRQLQRMQRQGQTIEPDLLTMQATVTAQRLL